MGRQAVHGVASFECLSLRDGAGNLCIWKVARTVQLKMDLIAESVQPVVEEGEVRVIARIGEAS